ncbi:hypothetical protein ABDD95_13150 [Mucilaginibacter sp. PAMB04274]|uniref:SPW repeat domain-containing protein n=1 Tax=Mucilaginibacter sp. PAMB04274 TaxID=3138568 RepID=UPI0031F6FDF7
MEKPISRQAHGAIDYAYGAVVAMLPELLDFKEEKKAVTLCRVLAGGALAYSLLTKAEWGVIKVLPFKKHLLIDFTTSLFALGAPWLLGFSHNEKARNAVIGVGLAGLSASTLTQAEDM